jgi:hypothetical protein
MRGDLDGGRHRRRRNPERGDNGKEVARANDHHEPRNGKGQKTRHDGATMSRKRRKYVMLPRPPIV